MGYTSAICDDCGKKLIPSEFFEDDGVVRCELCNLKHDLEYIESSIIAKQKWLEETHLKVIAEKKRGAKALYDRIKKLEFEAGEH